MARLKAPVTPHDHIRGPADAPVILVEYGDYECPICQLAHPIVGALQRHFGRKLALVFRHFPLTQIHPHAEAAAESAEFAGVHGRFWEMHDAIYERDENLSLPLLFRLAAALHLSDSALRDALENGTFEPKVRSDFVGGVRSGVNGTPTFFINGERYDGLQNFDVLAEAIDTRLHAKAS
jgi:protein-disulfide isomerase